MPTTDPTTDTKPATPRIRYTIGPDQLGFGPHDLKKGEWFGPVTNDLAGEVMRSGHVAEYGFEQEGYVAPVEPVPAADAPAADAPPANNRTARPRAPATQDATPAARPNPQE